MLNSTTLRQAISARRVAFNASNVCALLAGAAAVTIPSDFFAAANAKAPGHTYCFYSTCHRVKTLAETRALIGRDHVLPASFYDDCKADRYNPCGLTSSGEVFRPSAPDNAASPIYPDGTKLLVWSPVTKRALVLRINNAGPYWGNRTLDVSRGAAEKLGFKARGVANLKARVLEAPTKSEATYRKHRSYEAVAGDIGVYENFAAAGAANTTLQMIASATLAPFNGGSLPANLVTDDIREPGVAVAQAETTPRISREAVADASSLVAFKWPVVQSAEAKAANKPFTQTAALSADNESAAVSKPAKTRTAKADAETAAKPKAAVKSVATKRRDVEASDTSRTPRVKSEKREAAPAPEAKVPTRKIAVAQRANAIPVAKDVRVPPAAVAERFTSPRHTRPNDISMFSRYNAEPVRTLALPRAKIRQASSKPAFVKTSSLASGQRPKVYLR